MFSRNTAFCRCYLHSIVLRSTINPSRHYFSFVYWKRVEIRLTSITEGRETSTNFSKLYLHFGRLLFREILKILTIDDLTHVLNMNTKWFVSVTFPNFINIFSVFRSMLLIIFLFEFGAVHLWLLNDFWILGGRGVGGGFVEFISIFNLSFNSSSKNAYLFNSLLLQFLPLPTSFPFNFFLFQIGFLSNYFVYQFFISI